MLNNTRLEFSVLSFWIATENMDSGAKRSNVLTSYLIWGQLIKYSNTQLQNEGK